MKRATGTVDTTKATKVLLKSIFDLRAEVAELSALNASLVGENKDLQAKLDQLNHHFMNRDQVVHALEFALQLVTADLRKKQLQTKQFSFKEGDWVALPE